MGYGHADGIARQPQNADKGVAPPWYTHPDARKALAERDIGAVYRLRYRDGVSQGEIARRTGQRQSEVSEIMYGGRQVRCTSRPGGRRSTSVSTAARCTTTPAR